MIITQEPSVNHGYKLSQSLMYKNAIAIFGLVPMMALACDYQQSANKAGLEYIKQSMLEFKSPFSDRLRNTTAKNIDFLNGDKPRVYDLKTFDLALSELGYYESYNTDKLEAELAALKAFLDIGV